MFIIYGSVDSRPDYHLPLLQALACIKESSTSTYPSLLTGDESKSCVSVVSDNTLDTHMIIPEHRGCSLESNCAFPHNIILNTSDDCQCVDRTSTIEVNVVPTSQQSHEPDLQRQYVLYSSLETVISKLNYNTCNGEAIFVTLIFVINFLIWYHTHTYYYVLHLCVSRALVSDVVRVLCVGIQKNKRTLSMLYSAFVKHQVLSYLNIYILCTCGLEWPSLLTPVVCILSAHVMLLLVVLVMIIHTNKVWYYINYCINYIVYVSTSTSLVLLLLLLSLPGVLCMDPSLIPGATSDGLKSVSVTVLHYLFTTSATHVFSHGILRPTFSFQLYSPVQFGNKTKLHIHSIQSIEGDVFSLNVTFVHPYLTTNISVHKHQFSKLDNSKKLFTQFMQNVDFVIFEQRPSGDFHVKFSTPEPYFTWMSREEITTLKHGLRNINSFQESEHKRTQQETQDKRTRTQQKTQHKRKQRTNIQYKERHREKKRTEKDRERDREREILDQEIKNWPRDHRGNMLITTSLKDNRLRLFRSKTSASALLLRICSVCEESILHSFGQTMLPSDIPNMHLITIDNNPCLYMGDKDNSGRVFVCTTCLYSLNKKKPAPPKKSIFSLDLGGEVPSCLKNLTLPEMLLISPIICKSYVVKLVSFGSPQSAQRGIKGNSIAFMQDVEEVIKILPSVDNTAKYLKVCFIGDSSCPLPLQKIKKILKVRRQKIKDALHWLCRNHKGFIDMDITIDNNALETLPVDDIPSNILENITQSKGVHTSLSESSSYVPDHVQINSNNSISDLSESSGCIPIERSGIVDIDNTQLSDDELFHYACSNLDPTLITVRSSPNPVTSYKNPEFWTLSFPTLFPFGVGACTTVCLTGLNIFLITGTIDLEHITLLCLLLSVYSTKEVCVN